MPLNGRLQNGKSGQTYDVKKKCLHCPSEIFVEMQSSIPSAEFARAPVAGVENKSPDIAEQGPPSEKH